MNDDRKKIAIIGGGIAGLTAGYLLQRKYRVTLFEKSEKTGGNAYTLVLPDGEAVDIAAAVYGKHSYRNVFKLFRQLDIETLGSFGLNRFSKGLGAGFYDLETKQGIFLTPGIRSLISQRFDILRPQRLRNIAHLVRGVQRATRLSRDGALEGATLEEALKGIPELQGDAKLIFIGMVCLISSMHCSDVLDAPAAFFLDKLNAYPDLIPPRALFSICLTKNRTRHYIDALSAGYRNGIVLNAKIKSVARRDGSVIVSSENGKRIVFDEIVFACNADQALRLLEEPTPEEKRLLGAWKYTEGRVVVHTDHSLFPKRPLMEGYTFLYQKGGRYFRTSVSGSLWSLPGVSRGCNAISTQHPNFPIRNEHVLFEKVFRTPLFDFNSCSSLKELPTLNGVLNTYYCGSHFGFGLHEDAVTSAVDVAARLNVPF